MKKENAKSRIYKVYIQLLKDFEPHEITVLQVCQYANVNRSTFYAYFLDIIDLKDYAVSRILEEFLDMYRNLPEYHYNKDNCMKFLTYVYQNQTFCNAYFKLIPDSYEFINHDKRFELYDYYYLYYASGVTAIIKHWLNHGCRDSLEDMCQIILNINPNHYTKNDE